MNKTERQFKKSSKKVGADKYTPRMGSSEEARWKREGAAATKGLIRKGK